MPSRNLKKLTVSSLYLALAVILVLGASVVPGLDLTLLAVASAVTAFAVVEAGVRWGALLYAGASLLGILLAPEKSAALLYVLFFGLYPLVKYAAERPRQPGVQLAIKFAYFLAAAILSLAFFSEIVLGDLTLSDWLPLWGLLVPGAVMFVIYDYALTVAIRLYERRVHRK